MGLIPCGCIFAEIYTLIYRRRANFFTDRDSKTGISKQTV